MAFKNLEGRRIGKWTVLSREHSFGGHRVKWNCQCECGTEKTLGSADLLRSASAVPSCGCAKDVFDRACPECGVSKPPNEFYRNGRTRAQAQCIVCTNKRNSARYAVNRQAHIDTGKKYRVSLRMSTLAAYGGKCNCCGESREVFLALDHIHGGGSEEADRLGGGTALYRRLRNAGYPKDKYQLLCHNCNWAKHHTGGNCPHKQPNWMPAPMGGGPFFCEGA